ncbi:HNH endonuclease family protein, partial [Hydrogenivirga sp. 128-5-R1-1]|uniref:HNH endonuclease family protein n=1 Tax=Hydrogenivirga sp. 128-5-R1-1 TaxID=392423 RepID=UPI00015EFF3D
RWIYDKLKENKEVNGNFYENFIIFLEKMDKDLSLERLNNTTDLRKVFKELTKDKNYKHENANLGEENIKNKLEEKLNNGTSTEHYWFYKLEYLLWKEFKEKDKYFKVSKNKGDGGLEYPFGNFDYSKIKDTYRLTRKNSIEHIQAQSRANEWKEVQDNECSEKCNIDCFGNLTLISTHLNSSLLDKSFNEKRNLIANQLERGTIESLKMLLVYSKYDKWTPEECKTHHNEMIELLKNSLEN